MTPSAVTPDALQGLGALQSPPSSQTAPHQHFPIVSLPHLHKEQTTPATARNGVSRSFWGEGGRKKEGGKGEVQGWQHLLGQWSKERLLLVLGKKEDEVSTDFFASHALVIRFLHQPFAHEKKASISLFLRERSWQRLKGKQACCSPNYPRNSERHKSCRMG